MRVCMQVGTACSSKCVPMRVNANEQMQACRAKIREPADGDRPVNNHINTGESLGKWFQRSCFASPPLRWRVCCPIVQSAVFDWSFHRSPRGSRLGIGLSFSHNLMQWKVTRTRLPIPRARLEDQVQVARCSLDEWKGMMLETLGQGREK